MKIFSQITTLKNNIFDSKTPQQKIMSDLDQMCKQARKIKNRKKKQRSYGQKPGAPFSGCLDTQLFPPRQMKAEASEIAKASFFEKTTCAEDSFWKISYKNEEVIVYIMDLFPSKKYDINQIRTEDFGTALIMRLTNGNSLKEELEKLIKENVMEHHDISMEDIQDKEMIEDVVCEAVPLNDYQKNIRDSLENKASGN